jgi:hypothetical protein
MQAPPSAPGKSLRIHLLRPSGTSLIPTTRAAQRRMLQSVCILGESMTWTGVDAPPEQVCMACGNTARHSRCEMWPVLREGRLRPGHSPTRVTGKYSAQPHP